jgi:SAM-dependent methyltransferase
MPADIYDWVAQLKPGQWVLDVGAGQGSFPGAEFACAWLAVDDDPAAFTTPVRYARVVGKSHRLPVRDASIDLLICHHALEHLAPLDESLAEMARVLKPGARCYVSVPNGYGLCDAVYRLVFLGGGHVNRFRRDQVIGLVEQRLGVRLVAWHKLYSSFVYLRKLMELLETAPPKLPRRLLAISLLPLSLVGFTQRALYVGTRFLDRWLRTGLAVYGWAFFFEKQPAQPAPGLPVTEQPAVELPATEQPAFVNVCMHCGTGQPAASAPRVGRLSCRCPNCSRDYPYFRAFRNTV